MTAGDDGDDQVYASVAGLGELPLSNVALSGVPEGFSPQHPFGSEQGSRYQHPQLIALGGMGKVSIITDTKLRRQVALKQARPDACDVAGLERRLVQEALITAQLQHPGIVPVHDAGETEDGRLFFTMRLIRGESLSTVLASGDRDDDIVLRHFLTVCQAMAYAHSVGIVHRDLKPSNIMLGEFGETQIVDWGVATRVPLGERSEAPESPPRDASHVPAEATAAGVRVGTPAYMSPEQARAEAASPASDVWSLGAILFEVLSKRGLYTGASTEEILEILRRGPIPRVLDVAPGTSVELAAVVDRALTLDPRRRYANAHHLAVDVAAYLDGRRVGAYDYSPWDKAKRFGAAFRLPLLVAGAALLITAIVFGLSYSQTLNERDRAHAAERAALSARDRAVGAEAHASAALERAEQHFAKILVQQAQEAQASHAQVEAEILAGHALLRVESPEARGVLARYHEAANAELLSAEAVAPCRQGYLSPNGTSFLCLEPRSTSLWACDDLSLSWRSPRSFMHAAYVSESTIVAASVVSKKPLGVDAATGALLPISTTLFTRSMTHSSDRAIGHEGGRVMVWDSATNVATALTEPLGPLEVGQLGGPWALSGDGQTAVVYVPTVKRPYRVSIGTATGAPMAMLPWSDQGPMRIVLNHAGTRAAFGGTKGGLVVVDVFTGVTLWRRQVTARALDGVLWSPDERWLAVWDERGWISVYDAHGRSRVALPRLRVRDVAWRESGDGVLLVAYGEGEIRVYRMPSVQRPTLFASTSGIATLALSEARDRLALPTGDGDVRVYDIRTGALLGELGADNTAVAKDATFIAGDEAGGEVAVIWPAHARLAVWEPGKSARDALARVGGRRVISAANGELLVVSYGRQAYRIRDGEVVSLFVSLDGHEIIDGLASGDGRAVAFLSAAGRAQLLRVQGQDLSPPRGVVQLPEAVRLTLDQDGSVLAIAGREEVRVVDVISGEITRTVRVEGQRIQEVAVSPDGDTLAVGTMDGEVMYWDAEGRLRMIGAGHLERISGLAFGPGGEWLMSVSWDGNALKWGLSGLDISPETLIADLERQSGVGLQHSMYAPRR